MSQSLINRRSLLAALGAAGAVAMIETPALAGFSMRKRDTPFFHRIGKPIGLQLYTLGDLPVKDMDGTLAKLAAIGFTDIELPGLYNRTPAELRAAAERAGVRFSAIHLNMPRPTATPELSLMSAPQAIVDVLNVLGIYQAYLPLCPLPDGFSVPEGKTWPVAVGEALQAAGADHWKRTAALLNERASALKPFGIALGYHNHNMEFAPLGSGMTGWDILVRETDPALVNFELDLGWTSAAGLDPVAELGKLKGRVKAVHVKDVKPTTQSNYILAQDPTEVGSGRLDWAKILPAAQVAGVQHYYVEQEPPFTMDRLAAVTKSYGFLSRFPA